MFINDVTAGGSTEISEVYKAHTHGLYLAKCYKTANSALLVLMDNGHESAKAKNLNTLQLLSESTDFNPIKHNFQLLKTKLKTQSSYGGGCSEGPGRKFRI